jgi:hypothetical protein
MTHGPQSPENIFADLEMLNLHNAKPFNHPVGLSRLT